VAGRIKLIKNSNDRIGNRNRDLQACSAMLQITASLQPPTWWVPVYKAGNSSVSSGKVKNMCVELNLPFPICCHSLVLNEAQGCLYNLMCS